MVKPSLKPILMMPSKASIVSNLSNIDTNVFEGVVDVKELFQYILGISVRSSPLSLQKVIYGLKKYCLKIVLYK